MTSLSDDPLHVIARINFYTAPKKRCYVCNKKRTSILTSFIMCTGCRIYGHRRCLAKNNRLICEGIQGRRAAVRNEKTTGTSTSADASTQTPPWPIVHVERCITNGTYRIHLFSAGRTMVDGSVRILLVGIDFQVGGSSKPTNWDDGLRETLLARGLRNVTVSRRTCWNREVAVLYTLTLGAVVGLRQTGGDEMHGGLHGVLTVATECLDVPSTTAERFGQQSYGPT